MSQLSEHLENGAGAVDEIFRSLILEASLAEPDAPNPIVGMLERHLGMSPYEAGQVTEEHRFGFKHPVLQAGFDAFLAADGRSHEIVGVSCPISDPRFNITLAKLCTTESLGWPGATLGAATWQRLECGYQKYMRCLTQGMILGRDTSGPFAIWVTTAEGWRYVTVVTADPTRAKQITDEIARLGRENSPYVGEMFRPRTREFLPRPRRMTSDDIILPKDLLERIDQHAVGISEVADRLSAAGQHLKRGLLLYGPPGTGKTHTLRYLTSRLPAETTIILAEPRYIYLLDAFLDLAGPSAMVVLDDIDAIATDRSLPGLRTQLFELLELLDGLNGYGDVLFVLTTNRLDALEPAVAARPGRIDEALEVPRPDADCRHRLFARYRQGMNLSITDAEIDDVVERTEGVTGSFTRELLRRATIVAIEEGVEVDDDELVPVTGRQVFKALDEMLDPANPATRLLLGATPDHAVHKVIVTTEAAK